MHTLLFYLKNLDMPTNQTDLLDNITSDTACPACNSENVKDISWTWWGGLIGPRILKHTKCADCKFTYNRNTKKSNNTPIAIYLAVTTIIAFGIVYFVVAR